MTTRLTALLVAFLAYLAPPLLTCHAQTTISDYHLRVAVRRALGLPGNGDVPPETLLNLEQLSASSGHWESFDDDDGDGEYNDTIISTLVGLEHATNLTTLELREGGDNSGHELRDISPIAGSTSLKTITLRGAIDRSDPQHAQTIVSTVAALPSLTDLELSRTPLPDATVGMLADANNLQHLNLGATNITDISPLTNLTKLESLTVWRNSISIIPPLAPISQLATLNAFGNQLTDISGITGLAALHTLHLSTNQISDLSDIADLPALRTLHLANNQIADLSDLGELPALETLTLTNNKITHLTDVPELPALTTLDLKGNQLTDISGLADLTALQALDLTDNPTTDLRPLAGLQRLASLPLKSPDGIPISSVPPLGNLAWLGEVTVDTDLGPAARFPRIAGIKFAPGSKLLDLTPLANLQNIHTLDGPLTTNATSRLPQPLDLNSDLESLARSAYLPDEAVPDGKLRAKSRSLQLLSTWGLLSIEGIGEFSSLQDLTATTGWITDLSPFSATTPPQRLVLTNNFISDVSPLAGHTFTELDLTENPIDPDTVPVAWKTNPNIHLPQLPPLQPAETIPDPALRSAIRQAIGADPDHPVDPTALQNLIWLYAEHLDIRSLEGLDLATNLRGIALRNNIIKDLTPLAALPSLQWLRVSGNPLAASAAQTIQSLRAAGTRVDDNEAGRFLSGITPIDGIVYASGYQLTSARYLDLFPELTEVFLSDNYLSDIKPLASVTGLEKAHLDGNLLAPQRDTTIKASLDALAGKGTELILDPQRPESLHGDIVIPDPNIRWIIAPALRQNTPYDPLAYTHAQLESVTTLDWEAAHGSATPITNTSGIELMTNLEHLDLEGAGLTDITFLSGLTNLRTLDIDRNQITDLTPLANLTNLVELDANDNLITSVEPLAGLTNIELLDLDENFITDITPLATLTKLRVLDLHENQISSATFDTFVELQELNLDTNRITDISTLANLLSLKTVNLFDNHIADIAPLLGLTPDYLDIRLNQLDLTAPDTSAAINSLKQILPRGLRHLAQFRPDLSVTREGNELVISFIADPGVKYKLRHADALLHDFDGAGSQTLPLTEPRQEIEFRLPIEDRTAIYRIKYE